ncbi:MAG: hypothetical protein CMK89_10220 [Pseudomonadales bacterium]|nr:hypothetical protein [Pseudomonadales bacterium]
MTEPRATSRTRPAGKSTATKKTPRKKRVYLPAEERRKLILAAAREVFAKSGLKGARTRELAQSAGVNQATLFEHFSSKEELFSAAIIEPLQSMLEGSRQRATGYASASSDADLLERVREGLEQHMHSMIEMYPLLVQALLSDPELGAKIYNEHLEPMFASRSELMKEFVDPHINPRLLQLASFGMFFAVAMDQTLSDNPIEPKDLAQHLSDIILFGSSNMKRERKPKISK